MKLLIMLLFINISQASINKNAVDDSYYMHPDTQEAYDNLIIAQEKLLLNRDNRIKELKSYQTLSFVELQELHALLLVREGNADEIDAYLRAREAKRDYKWKLMR